MDQPADARQANLAQTESPKISVVTAVYNRRATLAEAMDSVARQTYPNLEYVVIDGMSDDGTAEVIEHHRDQIDMVIREPDQGIYDALNKGIEAATGDVVGFIHADDQLFDEQAIEHVAQSFADPQVDAVYGNLLYVDHDNPQKIIRYWNSGPFNRSRFRLGWMPPHPTVYIRKSVYQRLGGYRIDLGSAADYECMVRLLYKGDLNVVYCPHILVQMRVGGVSNATVSNRLKANQADRQAWEENGLKPPWGLRFTKPLRKIPQYFMRPRRR